MTKKKFDCVAMKRLGSSHIHQQLKGLSRAEELAYWRAQHRKLEKEWLAAKAAVHKPKQVVAR